MESFVHALLYFVIALGVLITFHEFGHFWVARRVGVKVLRFSIGFGKPLWRFQKTPESTEFVIAALPLGGYVKMVDEHEGTVAKKDLPYAFNRQPLWARTAIVSAGPLFNLLLAVLIYWFIFVMGETGIRPVLGAVEPDTLAGQAGFSEGDQIIAVAGEKTPTWNVAMSTLFAQVLDEKEIPIQVKTPEGVQVTRTLSIPSRVAQQPDLLRDRLGFRPFEPDLAPIIDHVEAGSPAERAGLISGDRIVSVAGTEVQSWQQWVDYVRAHPDEELTVIIERDGMRKTVLLQPARVQMDDEAIGRIGASVRVPPDVLEEMKAEYRLKFFPALAKAVENTGSYSLLTLKMIGRMLIGKASLENLSGPISIAQYAGQSASIGLTQFLKFLAIVSISLGVLNLLPIPVLDGGHLMFYLIEAVKGSPVSDHTMVISQQIGMAILLFLMSLAFFLDIERLLS